MQQLIYKLTGLRTEQEQAAVFNWFAAQPIAVQVEAMKLFQRTRNQIQEKFSIRKAPEGQEAEYFYALWLIAISKLKSLQTQEFLKRRDAAPNVEDLQRIEQLRLSRIRADKIAERDKRRGKKTLRYQLKYHLRNNIQNLLDNNASWPEIRSYLKKYHNIEVKSHEYLRQIWKYQILPELELQKQLITQEDIKND